MVTYSNGSKLMCDDEKVQRMLQTVISHLTEHGLRFGQAEARPEVFTSISTRKGSYFCFISVADEIFRCFTSISCHVPVERRQSVAELLVRINWKVLLGNFEIDFRDGEIRYRVTVDLRAGELTDGMVESALRASLSTVDQFFPAIMSVLWNDVSPADAVAMADGEVIADWCVLLYEFPIADAFALWCRTEAGHSARHHNRYPG